MKLEMRNRVGRYNFGKSDFNRLRKFFEGGNWSNFEKADNIQTKWQEFIKMYEMGVEKYVPRIKENKRKNMRQKNTRLLPVVRRSSIEFP